MAAGSVIPPTVVPLRTPDKVTVGKQYIDTNVPIELRSITSGAEIYFTVDGTRPELNQRFGQKTTHHYTAPIHLHAGKQTLKAVAVDRNERQSAVVTKVFFVSVGEEDLAPDEVQPWTMSLKQSRKTSASSTSSVSWADTAPNQHARSAGLSSNMLCSRPSSTGGPHFLSARFDKLLAEESAKEASQAPTKRVQTPAEAQQTGQDTGFLKCVYCFAQRPADPFSRFCGECGSPMPPVPPRRANPPNPGELGRCLYCQNSVPLDAPKCMVCDAPMQPQLQPQAAKRLQRRIICTGCGMANPPELKVCVACETELTALVRDVALDDVKPEPAMPDTAPTCTPCDRQLALDSRFCDGCGGKVMRSSTAVECKQCRASNSGQHRCCTSCGASLVYGQAKTTLTPRPSSSSLSSTDGPGKAGSKDGSWLIVPPPKPPGKLKTQSCQTDGLFFPSAKAIENMKGSEVEKILTHLNTQDRATRDLTQPSPGKGYWRQQADHICAHIKAYAQNSTDFQTAISHPLMGRVLAATARQDDHEMTFSFTFDLKSRPQSRSSSRNGSFATSTLPRTSTPTSTISATDGSSAVRPASTGASLSGLLLASAGYDRLTGTSSAQSMHPPHLSSSTVRSTTRRKTKKKAKLTQSPEDCLLLRELADKDGAKDRVVRLLREGASANCRDRQSLPALSVAATNGRSDCICALVDNGAKIQQQDTNGNTALHAAIVKGSEQVSCVEELLRCGINPDIRNKLGQTAYDVAIKKNNQTLIQCLASNVGTQLLGPLTRTTKTKSST